MSSPSVQTSFSDGSSNMVRPESRTYPDGRVVSDDYGAADGLNDRCSRVAALVDDDDTHLADYEYLGLGAVVKQSSPEPDLLMTLVSLDGANDPDTGDIYSGVDRFGRVKDLRWRDVSGATDLSRIQYGYNRASNRTFRRNPTDPAAHYDWLYNYDGLQRLEDAQRGTLTGGHTGITDPQFAQCWTLDPTGNWRGFRQADAGGGSPWDLVQARLANPVNEITGITNSTGPAWAQPAYDAAGNMTTVPQPADPTTSYAATYDAWNRLVKLVDTDTDDTVQENAYDGRGYRTVRKSYTGGALSETRHFYYTDGWRCVEERVGTSPDTADPDRQFVWGLRYIDDLVFRDRGAERLYALQDGNWNVTAVVDDAGSVQERYEYDPYGEVRFLDAEFTPRGSSIYGWETTYCGYRWDILIGMFAVRFRQLHLLLGWTRCDPLGYLNGNNLYKYLNNSPLTYVDPLGAVDTYSFEGFFSGWLNLIPAHYKALPTWKTIERRFEEELKLGCVGVAHLLLGYPAGEHPSLEFCYRTMPEAQRHKEQMDRDRTCGCPDTVNVYGGEPAARIIAIALWNLDQNYNPEVDLTPKPGGNIDLSNAWDAIHSFPPWGGPNNFDFFFFAANGHVYGADHRHCPSEGWPGTVIDRTYDEAKATILKYLDWPRQDPDEQVFDTVVFCVVCQRAFRLR